MNKRLPNNLRELRKNSPDPSLRSGERIAELMGISKQYYYDLETGRNNCRLNSEHLKKLTKILKATADEILGDSELEEIQKKQLGSTPEQDEPISVFDDPQVRELARRSLRKDPSKEALLKKLIKSMLEED